MKFKLGPIDFTQPSTWRGAAGIAALCGISLSPELTDQIAIALGAVLSAIELFRNEHAAHNAPKADAMPSELKEFADAAQQLRQASRAMPTDAALPNRKLRQSVSAEPETTRNPESPGFGDR